MSVTCPSGHVSETTDFCSVCGVELAPGPSAGASGAPAPAATTVCPDCQTPRSNPADRYCEVCRYDFQTGSSSLGVAPPVTASAPGATTAPIPGAGSSSGSSVDPSAAAPGASARWELLIEVDPTLDGDPDPATPCPVNDPPLTFPIDLSEMLIGRRDDTRGIRPEIPLRDPGVSHRHAQIIRQPDGAIAIRDLASRNHTEVNGNEIPPGMNFLLNPNDIVTIGRWTKITLKQV